MLYASPSSAKRLRQEKRRCSGHNLRQTGPVAGSRSMSAIWQMWSMKQKGFPRRTHSPVPIGALIFFTSPRHLFSQPSSSSPSTEIQKSSLRRKASRCHYEWPDRQQWAATMGADTPAAAYYFSAIFGWAAYPFSFIKDFGKKMPSFRISLPSNQTSPPPQSLRWMLTMSQWTCERLPLSASS
jgi:hypothetical protein